MQYLWNSQEAKLLWQQGQVGEANAAPDRMENGTVAEVHLRGLELQVCASHHCLHCKVDRLHLNTQTWSLFTDLHLMWIQFILSNQHENVRKSGCFELRCLTWFQCLCWNLLCTGITLKILIIHFHIIQTEGKKLRGEQRTWHEDELMFLLSKIKTFYVCDFTNICTLNVFNKQYQYHSRHCVLVWSLEVLFRITRLIYSFE